MPNLVALLRGINVGGHRKIAMAELRNVAEDAGLAYARSYIQSGNLVGDSSRSPEDFVFHFELFLKSYFGMDIDVMARSAADWAAFASRPAFPDAAAARPDRLMLVLSKAPPAPDAAALLTERAGHGEQIAAADGALWIHYPAGAGKTKLTPALLERAVGSPTTSRNYKTVLALQNMLTR